jgi:hypothetical protein
MGIKINSCYSQYQTEDEKNSYIYCCKKKIIYNDYYNSNQIEVENENNDSSNNKKKISNENLPTNETNIPKMRTMKKRSKKKIII